MAQHGAIKVPGRVETAGSIKRIEDLNNAGAYRIFTECARKSAGFRKQLRPGTKVRVDLFNGFPFWKVTELLKCRNWKVDDRCDKGDCITYYVDILEE